jgi:hypothetical protein
LLRLALVDEFADSLDDIRWQTVALPIGHILAVLGHSADPHVVRIAAADGPATVIARV